VEATRCADAIGTSAESSAELCRGRRSAWAARLKKAWSPRRNQRLCRP